MRREHGRAVEFQRGDVACHGSVIGVDEVLARDACLAPVNWEATEAVEGQYL